MPQQHFQLKPSMFNALFPRFIRNIIAYTLASATVYGILMLLSYLDILSFALRRLQIALLLIAVAMAIISIKHRMIKLHRTKYTFYDTHVVEETGIIRKRRHSMPYKQISKVINESSIWDRITNASDIILKSSRHQDGHDMLLRSVKNADEIEHKIYKLLKETTEETE